MRCERCGTEAVGYAVHDYCASCSANLCTFCMERGCCGRVPAESGEAADGQITEEKLWRDGPET